LLDPAAQGRVTAAGAVQEGGALAGVGLVEGRDKNLPLLHGLFPKGCGGARKTVRRSAAGSATIGWNRWPPTKASGKFLSPLSP
jgi:hypothetical protein